MVCNAEDTDKFDGLLPKTISGKIRRVELRVREQEVVDQRPPGEHRYEDFFTRS